MMISFVSCPYQYNTLCRVRPWVIWTKRILLESHLACFFERWRGRKQLSEYTGGWNVVQKDSDFSQRRLNLGSGQANYKGYINLDVKWAPYVHVQAAGQKLPFESGTFDEVLCVDVIEHFDIANARSMLDEILRVLRYGGHLILVTPDLDDIVRAHRSGFATHAQIVQHLLGEERDHRYIYTVSLLTLFLCSSGFVIDRIIRHWGPIWAHTVVLAERR